MFTTTNRHRLALFAATTAFVLVGCRGILGLDEFTVEEGSSDGAAGNGSQGTPGGGDCSTEGLMQTTAGCNECLQSNCCQQLRAYDGTIDTFKTLTECAELSCHSAQQCIVPYCDAYTADLGISVVKPCAVAIGNNTCGTECRRTNSQGKTCCSLLADCLGDGSSGCAKCLMSNGQDEICTGTVREYYLDAIACIDYAYQNKPECTALPTKSD